MDFWTAYILAYGILAFTYITYRYAFVLAAEEKTPGTYSGKISVIIPFYNEDPDLLINTVKSVDNCHGDKEIIVIDDGSTNLECYHRLLKLELDFKLIRYENNQGKRYAQVEGFNHATGDIIGTIDSDTVLDQNALVELMKPFSDEKVGATTGQLEVLNHKESWLTRLQSARYWNAFNFERRCQSALGVVVCCCGAISAYRKSIIDDIKYKFLDQKFLGKKATYGDDRHLTTLILKDGYNVSYVDSALGYTEVPSTFAKFWNQQVRWRKSWLRETYLVSKFMTKRSKALTFEIVLTTIVPFFSVLARLSLIALVLLEPSRLLHVIPIMFLIITLHSTYMIVHKPSYYFYNFAYGVFHAFVIYWVLFAAIFEFRNIGWGTR